MPSTYNGPERKGKIAQGESFEEPAPSHLMSSKRLKDEVVAWHRLQHPNIAKLHGVIQHSNTIAMVSPWCENGTICYYLKEVNPTADRLKLVRKLPQIVLFVYHPHLFQLRSPK